MAKKKKDVFPEYSTDLPIFPAISNLWADLSIQDSGLQSNQIAIEFLQEHITMTNVDENIFVSALASKFKISSGSTTWNENKRRIAESYIVLTYNVAEVFFKRLRKEILLYQGLNYEEWIATRKVGGKTQKIDPFNQIISNLDRSKQKDITSKPEYHLIEYYRLLRNKIVHTVDESNSKPLEYYNNRLEPIKPYFRGYYKFINEEIPAPNRPGDITFRDFILYSRALRYFAYLINEHLALTGEQIYSVHKDDTFFKHSVPVRYYDPKSDIDKREKRLYNQIKVYLLTNFKNYTDQHIKEIREIIVKNKNVRR